MKKKILTVLIVILVLGALAAGFVIWRFTDKYISHREAVEIAMAESAIDGQILRDVDCEFEWSPYSAWYEVSIDIHGFEYEYSIDAISGEILHSSYRPD